MNDDPDRTVVPLAALEHYQYCPRQCALIHLDGVWFDNAHTDRGQRGHRRVDTGPAGTTRGVTVLRGIPLWSDTFALSGRADAVEIHPDGQIVPVEYKMGTRHDDAGDVQLCAQALCLEEMSGRNVTHGYLWLSAHRRRHGVTFDAGLRSRTRAAIEEVRRLLGGPRLPGAPDDARCSACQFLGHCLPGVVAHPGRVTSHMRQEVWACES